MTKLSAQRADISGAVSFEGCSAGGDLTTCSIRVILFPDDRLSSIFFFAVASTARQPLVLANVGDHVAYHVAYLAYLIQSYFVAGLFGLVGYYHVRLPARLKRPGCKISLVDTHCVARPSRKRASAHTLAMFKKRASGATLPEDRKEKKNSKKRASGSTLPEDEKERKKS